MTKLPTDVEKFAAKIADKQDNPTIHELAKAFPEKTYRELEIYRDSDRHAEANQVPLTEAQKNLVEHIEAGSCIMGEMRKDREEPDRVKEAQEALANALEVNESHRKFNGKLQMRIIELEQDNLELHAENKKMHNHLDERVNAARKGGM